MLAARAGRHAGIGCIARVLGDGDAPVELDGTQPMRPVRAGAREHDPCRTRAEVLFEGRKESIDGIALASRLRGLGQSEDALLDEELGVGGDDVNVIGTGRGAALDRRHRHGGVAGQQLRQDAGVLRVEVLNLDEGAAGIRPHVAEEFLQSLEAAGGGSHRDDGARRPRSFDVHVFRMLRLVNIVTIPQRRNRHDGGRCVLL